MGNITHIELTSSSPEETTNFYAQAFGWESTSSPFLQDYFTSSTGDGDGIDAAIMSSKYQSQNTIIWIVVENLEATLTAVKTAGGNVPGEFHDLPGVGRVGYVTDPNGVVIGLKQPA